jgi:PAS domain-containing protein
MSFCSKLAQMISKSNYNNIILADTLAKKALAEEALQEKNEEYEALNEELQSSVEELQSATEELQVQNEELQQQEVALRESEERYRGLVTNLNAGVVVHAAAYYDYYK